MTNRTPPNSEREKNLVERLTEVIRRQGVTIEELENALAQDALSPDFQQLVLDNISLREQLEERRKTLVYVEAAAYEAAVESTNEVPPTASKLGGIFADIRQAALDSLTQPKVVPQ